MRAPSLAASPQRPVGPLCGGVDDFCNVFELVRCESSRSEIDQLCRKLLFMTVQTETRKARSRRRRRAGTARGRLPSPSSGATSSVKAGQGEGDSCVLTTPSLCSGSEQKAAWLQGASQQGDRSPDALAQAPFHGRGAGRG